MSFPISELFGLVIPPIAGGIVVAVVNHYFKKTDERASAYAVQMKATQEEVQEFKDRLTEVRDQLKDRIEASDERIFERFKEMCKERQGHCSDLVTEKVNGIARKADAICAARSAAWNAQFEFNRKVEVHLERERNRGR